MDSSTPVVVALVGACATFIGYIITNSLDRRKAMRVREMEFRLDRYKEFLVSFGLESGAQTPETHLRWVSAFNTVLLIGGPRLLDALRALATNYNDAAGTAKTQKTILEHIVLQMREDLSVENAGLEQFEFPVLSPDPTVMFGPKSRPKSESKP